MSDRGAASPVLVAMLALAGLLCLATTDAANVLVTRARVQAAADAAALAAAAAQWAGSDDPRSAASAAAADNGAVLEACACERHRPTATVEVSAETSTRMLGVAPRQVTARATASVEVARLFVPGGRRQVIR